MNYLLDIILVVLMIVIIAINTKRGCKTILNLLTPVVSFAAAYFIGPTVGKSFLTDGLTKHVSDIVYSVLESVSGEGGSTLTVGEIIEKLPEELSALLAKIGVDVNAIVEFFGSMTVASQQDLVDITNQISVPVATFFANAIGCIIVFVAALIVMFIVKKIVGGLVKLPILKQANSLLGFLLGIICAFVYTWVICLAITSIIDLSLLGEYNAVLSSLAENSVICRFFCGLSWNDIVNSIPAVVPENV